MTLAEAVSFGLDAMDLIGLLGMLGSVVHAKRVQMRETRSTGIKAPRCYRRSEISAIPGIPYGRARTIVPESIGGKPLFAERYFCGESAMKDWDDGLADLIEPKRIKDTFVTRMCKVERIGSGDIVRCWFSAEEAGDSVLLAKLVIPLQCAAIMNLHSTHVLTKMLRERPHIARLVHS